MEGEGLGKELHPCANRNRGNVQEHEREPDVTSSVGSLPAADFYVEHTAEKLTKGRRLQLDKKEKEALWKINGQSFHTCVWKDCLMFEWEGSNDLVDTLITETPRSTSRTYVESGRPWANCSGDLLKEEIKRYTGENEACS